MRRRLTILALAALCLCGNPTRSEAQLGGAAGGDVGQTQTSQPATTAPTSRPSGVEDVLKSLPVPSTPGGTMTAVQWILAITLLAVAPAVLVMVTSFTRIIVVLGLLRQALATQQLPPQQVLVGLAVFMSLAVMSPTIGGVYDDAVAPYMAGKLTQAQALDAATSRVRQFMTRQIESAGNQEDVRLFLSDDVARRDNLTWRDVPTTALIPGFVVSELKVAFKIGLQIFLPFLVIDMLVASVLTSMGMLMLPPVLISLPFKLLLFVLVDGWHLVVGMLMQSFR